MTGTELEIGRNLGSTAFFIYSALKYSHKCSARDLEIETGLSYNIIKAHLKIMFEVGIVKRTDQRLLRARGYVYSLAEDTEWKFH